MHSLDVTHGKSGRRGKRASASGACGGGDGPAVPPPLPLLEDSPSAGGGDRPGLSAPRPLLLEASSPSAREMAPQQRCGRRRRVRFPLVLRAASGAVVPGASGWCGRRAAGHRPADRSLRVRGQPGEPREAACFEGCGERGGARRGGRRPGEARAEGQRRAAPSSLLGARAAAPGGREPSAVSTPVSKHRSSLENAPRLPGEEADTENEAERSEVSPE